MQNYIVKCWHALLPAKKATKTIVAVNHIRRHRRRAVAAALLSKPAIFGFTCLAIPSAAGWYSGLPQKVWQNQNSQYSTTVLKYKDYKNRDINKIPEPSSLPLLGFSLIGFWLIKKAKENRREKI